MLAHPRCQPSNMPPPHRGTEPAVGSLGSRSSSATTSLCDTGQALLPGPGFSSLLNARVWMAISQGLFLLRHPSRQGRQPLLWEWMCGQFPAGSRPELLHLPYTPCRHSCVNESERVTPDTACREQGPERNQNKAPP